MSICKWMGWALEDLYACPDDYIPVLQELIAESNPNANAEETIELG